MMNVKTSQTYRVKRYVCACEKISEEALVEIIREQQLTQLPDVKRAAGVGIGCGCCQMALKMVLDRAR